MKKKETVNARYEERYAKTTVLYADSSKVLFYDAEKTDKVLKTELKDLFLTGVTISAGDALYKPSACTTLGLIVVTGTSTVTGEAYTGSEPAA